MDQILFSSIYTRTAHSTALTRTIPFRRRRRRHLLKVKKQSTQHKYIPTYFIVSIMFVLFSPFLCARLCSTAKK